MSSNKQAQVAPIDAINLDILNSDDPGSAIETEQDLILNEKLMNKVQNSKLSVIQNTPN